MVCEVAYMDCDCRSLAVRDGIEAATRCRFFWPPSDFAGSVLHGKGQSASKVLRRPHNPCWAVMWTVINYAAVLMGQPRSKRFMTRCAAAESCFCELSASCKEGLGLEDHS